MAHYRIPFPPVPATDLRTMLHRHLVNRAFEGMLAGDRRREEALAAGSAAAHLHRVRDSVRAAFGEMPFAASGGPLELETVSRHETRTCTIENVLFDSFPGWRVNASVFIPKTAGPHRAIVIPVGHSGKQFANYQIPAQAFASLGYVAVLFDPPGQASEKQPGNDHFRDGVRSFLLGLSPNRYFVLDALRCIDYLETRDDVDLSRGVGMTGVSGGGVTTLFAAIFDDRIACTGPSCCINRVIDHPLGDSYSECPEKYWDRRIADGIDAVDIALASYPVPMLYMAGRDDEVFTIDKSRELAALCAAACERLGGADRFAFYEDASGHAYTLEQVARFAAWMERWIGGEADPSVPRLDPDVFSMLDYEQLRCRPAAEANMFTISREMGRRLARERPAVPATEAAARLVGTPGAAISWVESAPFRVWMQDHTEALCNVEGLDVPTTVYRPHGEAAAATLVVVVDDRGRTAALEGGGLAQQLSGMTDRDAEGALPVLAVPDLPGWGDSRPALVPYAAASWGSMDRFLSYLSFGLGDGLLALRTRCLVALCRELLERGAGTSVVLVGRRTGGIVATLAAGLMEEVRGLALLDSLASFQHLLEAERYAWPAEAFVPNALAVSDLPQLLAQVAEGGVKVTVINPRDGERALVDQGEWRRICPALAGEVRCTDDEATAVAHLREVVGSLTGRKGRESDTP